MQLQQRGAYRSSLLLCYIALRLVRRVRDTSFAQNGGGAAAARVAWSVRPQGQTDSQFREHRDLLHSFRPSDNSIR